MMMTVRTTSLAAEMWTLLRTVMMRSALVTRLLVTLIGTSSRVWLLTALPLEGAPLVLMTRMTLVV